MNQNQALFEYLLRLGDSDMILGQRLCEWVGNAPALEEEMAIGNVALDLIGQARSWLTLAAEVASAAELEAAGRSADDLAFTRDERAYRNLLIVEQANGNFADTMARQYLFDVWHYHLLSALSGSADERVAAIAAKGLKEVTYHLRRSSAWIKRLGDGTEESHARMQDAIDEIWTYSGEMFIADEVDNLLAVAGIGADLNRLRSLWQADVQALLAEATLNCPSMDEYMQRGSKQGLHTEQLGFLLAEMQFLPRAYPGASW
ncbi:phenylacetate-CoA oxygenase subunit PaaC [Marinobacterium sp. D7]|uniref:1,2-phenylacetyl-CoA epoxidase subunit PaaC n=1 Tax=Marinobacterium ramblicola TaxID=2849041 RepID=UPI001C2D5F4F|nr:1,2-phenylacetyl-CoA epoxidase subunit PaaC [Marinobacterium ramblicola]MBV1787345.1 phenylacetate-CoA oxygenase subunit PaaC [Marinobacterium ramblicola]